MPVFAGYVGAGLLDAAVVGEVFASPPSDTVANAIRLASTGARVLRLYGNYGGDGMNFDMAGELVEMDDTEKIFSNPGHAYMTVAGLRLDTSAADDPSNQQGPRWRPLRVGNEGYVVRHPLGL